MSYNHCIFLCCDDSSNILLFVICEDKLIVIRINYIRFELIDISNIETSLVHQLAN